MLPSGLSMVRFMDADNMEVRNATCRGDVPKLVPVNEVTIADMDQGRERYGPESIGTLC